MTTAEELDDLVLETLHLLEWRLKRVEFILNGMRSASEDDITEMSSVRLKMQRLEHSLQKLSTKSETVVNVLQLQRSQPEIFARNTSSALTTTEPTTTQALATVLAAAPTLQTTASQLRALSDLSPPPTSGLTTLIALGPRIEAAAQRQAKQEQQVSDLRKRSAGLVVRWHEVDIKAQMRCWVDWEARVRKVEREMRRTERQQNG